MRPLILCRERLERIQYVLARSGGRASLRDLWRNDSIRGWEVSQAAEMGWLNITKRQPRVAEFRGSGNAKVPKFRRDIETEISNRHWMFAMRSVGHAAKHGIRSLGLPGIVEAYVMTYQPRSRNGAAASTCRLLKRRDVRAARAWFYALSSGEIPKDEPMLRSASEIRQRLAELGSWRVAQC